MQDIHKIYFKSNINNARIYIMRSYYARKQVKIKSRNCQS